MNLNPKSLTHFAVILAATAALVATGQAAQAADQRPCVSKREFYGARDFGIVIPPDHDWMSRVPPPTDNPVGRLTLEDKWDVRHRGVTVSHTLGGPTVGTSPLVSVKMYRSCEHALADLQVYVGYHKDTNLVLWTMWLPTSTT